MISPSLTRSIAHRTEASRRPLRLTGLQDPQLAVLDGELDILHVAELVFKAHQRFAQLRRDVRQQTGDRVFGFGVALPDTTSSPCA